MELINDVLNDPDPAGEGARSQLRKQLASHPDDPGKAFLGHLIWTRKMASEHHLLPAAGDPPAQVPAAGLLEAPVPADAGMEKEIQSVLRSRLLLTAFQPIRELPGGKVKGFEALARFVSSDGASADTWFDEAETVGLGLELEIAALECALSAARGAPAHLFVAFNVSPTTFTHTRVQDLLEQAELGMDRIIIELRGRASDEQWNGLLCSVNRLRRRGLRVSVDGSGSGFTPVDRILSLRPDVIKLDRNFIEGIFEGPDQDEPDVVGLAREIGAVLTAEGIETEAELAAAIDAGLNTGQGYLLGRPSVHPVDWRSWMIQTTAGVTGES